MTVSATPKLYGYSLIVAAELLAAVALRRPEFVALATPFLLIVVTGLVLTRRPEIDVTVALDRQRALEGDEATLTVTMRSLHPIPRLDVFVPLSEGLRLEDGHNPVALRLPAGAGRDLPLVLRCERWGGYRVGRVELRAHGPGGLLRLEAVADRATPLRVFPAAERALTLLDPPKTQVFTGNRVARQHGEGIEFADMRPFVPGDRIRHINWRASARSGDVWVNQYHAERNSDVVILVDSFAEVWQGGRSSLDPAVRAAASLAQAYLRHRDRVGIISYGGALSWLGPQVGLAQLYRILDALIETEVLTSYVFGDVDLLPRRLLPPQAFVVALTPLLDERSERTLMDLRARGFDLAIIEISPAPFVRPGPSGEQVVAYRLWDLMREARRGRFQRLGVPVATWDEHTSLAGPLEEVRTFWRFARQPLG